MERNVITFDESLKKEILDIFDKTVDDEGYIIEKDTKERVLSPDGEEIELEKFAGITKGSEIFIKSDIFSLIDLTDRLITQ